MSRAYPMNIFEQYLQEVASGKRPRSLRFQRQPDENGLVFVGGNLDIFTLFEAYTNGCFPWSGERPIPWYSPDPRLVLFPYAFNVSRSLRRFIRKQRFRIRFDTNFEAVMRMCATTPRAFESGTWITESIIDAYCTLHRHHIAHSVEVYEGEKLCGGLYGLAFGRVFCGESMFSLVPNTSKLALYSLCQFLVKKQFYFIDCQQITAHMIRLGALPLSRRLFLQLLNKALYYPSLHYKWSEESELTNEKG
ncbi:MAG: leucyl/phenylalanyl-tRNA--protein transferase [bacterium]